MKSLFDGLLIISPETSVAGKYTALGAFLKVVHEEKRQRKESYNLCHWTVLDMECFMKCVDKKPHSEVKPPELESWICYLLGM